MIIDNTYFIDEIFIPHAKPAITDDVTAIGEDIVSFINTYSREALLKCLGYKLFKEFTSELDANEANGLKPTADQKWDDLLNGKEYTDLDGNLVEWRGIRYQNVAEGEYNKSLLAEYVYFFYEKSQDDDRVGVGNVKQAAANSTLVSKTPKVIAAWKRFIKQVQGDALAPTIHTKNGLNSTQSGYGIGIDWYGNNSEISLYKFILDTNYTTPDTYADFNPTYFGTLTQFGL